MLVTQIERRKHQINSMGITTSRIQIHRRTLSRSQERITRLSQSTSRKKRADYRWKLTTTIIPTVSLLQQIQHANIFGRINLAQRRSPKVCARRNEWNRIRQPQPRIKTNNIFYENKDDYFKQVCLDGPKIVVPQSQIQHVTYRFHGDENCAHPGRDETYRKIQEYFHWTKLRQHIAKYIKNRLICATIKPRQLQPAALLQTHSANIPFHTISLNTLGPYPETKRRNRFMIVSEDLYTKWVEVKPTITATSKAVINFLNEYMTWTHNYRSRISVHIKPDDSVLSRKQHRTSQCRNRASTRKFPEYARKRRTLARPQRQEIRDRQKKYSARYAPPGQKPTHRRHQTCTARKSLPQTRLSWVLHQPVNGL